ncbi:rhodanese-like domain-containing protein [Pedobacter sp. P351]|uniref:rhodanese-like domain-containing protein n=1 Tax=Pedobacter superstes TaxID=3133441 RepID=UPI0030A3DFE7
MFGSFFSKKENDLDGKTFRQMFAETGNAELIDVRTSGEFASGTIKGAKNMDLMSADFQTQVQKLDSKKTYFLFCRSGNRSGNAASLFEKHGLKSYNLVGGTGAWPAS